MFSSICLSDIYRDFRESLVFNMKMYARLDNFLYKLEIYTNNE